MLSPYTVFDVRPQASGTVGSYIVEAHSPEDAATRALGLDLIRTGPPAYLQAKVHFQAAGREVLVRLYARPGSPAR